MSVTTSTPFRQTPITRALISLNFVPKEYHQNLYPQNLEAAIFLASQRNRTKTTRPMRQSRPQVQEATEEKQLIKAAIQLETNEYTQMNGVSTQWPPDPLLPDVSCWPRLKKKPTMMSFLDSPLTQDPHLSFVWICTSSLLPGRAKSPDPFD